MNSSIHAAVPLCPSKLGLDLLALIPEHAEATWYSCHYADERQHPDFATIEAWNRASWDEIKQLAGEIYNRADNIVDIAIALAIWTVDRFAADEPPQWEGSDTDTDPHDMLAVRMVDVVLRSAGISQEAISVDGHWRKNGWDGRPPTDTERQAALHKRFEPAE